MLFVPREPFPAALPGLAPPRAVPSDLVVAAASRILPADILQKLILLAIFVLACAGAAALLDREPLLARLAAGAFYAWNPYVAERLIIGHWALLLGYAALPWVLRAILAPDLVSRRGAARLSLALLPAAIGGFAALSITALVAIPVAAVTGNPRPARPVEQRGCGTLTGRPIRLPHPRGCRAALAGDPRRPVFTADPRRPVLVLAALTVGSLPWLMPSLLHLVYVDPASVAAFAARADTPFGSLGSLLMLGGAWNAQTVPQAYGGPWSALWLATVTVALAAYLLLTRTHPRWPGLGTAATAGLLIAAAGITTPGRDLLRSLIAVSPGFAILRDAQQFVAPLALLESLGLGLAVTAALNPRPFRRKALTAEHPALAHQSATPSVRPLGADPPGTAFERPARADLAGTLLGVLALLAPVVLLPGLAWGAAGRLHPAWYPATWLSAAQTLDASPAPGSVLLLPWATYRTPTWNHGEVVIDPWTHLLSRPLIWNDGTQVGSVALLPDDPRARILDAAIEGTGPLTATLRAAGVRFVLDDADGSQLQVAARLPGSVMIVNLPGLTVYQLPG